MYERHDFFNVDCIEDGHRQVHAYMARACVGKKARMF